MRSSIPFRWLPGAGPLVLVVLVFTPFSPRSQALGEEKPGRPAAEGRAVSYLKEVRPILAQHCFQCHGPDEAARKGKLRLDLKDTALNERKAGHAIVSGRPNDSLVWKRITTEDKNERMPPLGQAEQLTKKQIATLKT